MDDDSPGRTETAQPPYLHIADVLRGEIHDEVFPVGASLPPQAELEKRFNVSRPTIQRALKELRRDGYIDNQRGRPAVVQDWDTEHVHPERVTRDEPAPTYAVLGSYLAEAFQARHITLDAFSLTAESLRNALATPLERILSGELTPASIRVRILLPTLDSALAIPRLVGGDEQWPLDRLRDLARAQAVSLRSAFTTLTEAKPDLDQTVEIRAVPITPVEKLYVLNGATVLTGRYRVVRREVKYHDREGEIFDVLGVGAVLFPYRKTSKKDSTGSRFVEEAQNWFDSLWLNIAEPLRL